MFTSLAARRAAVRSTSPSPSDSLGSCSNSTRFDLLTPRSPRTIVNARRRCRRPSADTRRTCRGFGVHSLPDDDDDDDDDDATLAAAPTTAEAPVDGATASLTLVGEGEEAAAKEETAERVVEDIGVPGAVDDNADSGCAIDVDDNDGSDGDDSCDSCDDCCVNCVASIDGDDRSSSSTSTSCGDGKDDCSLTTSIACVVVAVVVVVVVGGGGGGGGRGSDGGASG